MSYDEFNTFMWTIICLCLALPLVIIFIYHFKNRETNSDRYVNFYYECKRENITDFNNEYTKAKVKLIAEKYGFAYKWSDYGKLYEKAKEVAEKQNQRNSLENLRAKQIQQHKELTQFAHCHGVQKRIAMLTSTKTEHVGKVDYLNKEIASRVKSREDWLFASVDMVHKIESDIVNYLGTIQDHNEKIYKIDRLINEARTKVVANLSSSEVMKYLTFSNAKVIISETGAFSITCTAEVSNPIDIFGSVTAVVDGTVSADLYQNGTKIGSALMSLPLFGIAKGERVEIVGVCLAQADEKIPSRIEFTPHSLWIMEK